MSKPTIENPKINGPKSDPLDLIDQAANIHNNTSFDVVHKDFGAFLEKFVVFPCSQPPLKPLSGLTFAVSDSIDVKNHISGFGSPSWKATHKPAKKMAVIVADLLKRGATCVGKTVSGELGFGIAGENAYNVTLDNPQFPEIVHGGSSSGSSVAVASGIVDFALGIDTVGDIRIPASFCGVIGFRPSHGAISTIGVIPNSGSLDCVGFLARNPSVLQRLAHPLMQVNPVAPEIPRQLIFAEDLFELCEVTKDKIKSIIAKAITERSGYKSPISVNIIHHIASNVPSLRIFYGKDVNVQDERAILATLSFVMVSLQR
ncbi:unnamed protein product [Linum tenue]|uniref:Amidase domain-containing protein n=1 Tax=Linum tenue TaxID=586396 RepID=A0AAV0I0S9_9ROSI|nr:unnamed protein product [Linum tenue]